MATPQLTDEQWRELDPYILRCQKLPCLVKIREMASVGLHEALDMFGQRYEKLRRERPDDFSESHEAYWEGFYS